MGRGELLLWIQLVVCAAIFLALVVAKINMPARFESLRAAFSAQMEHSVDYREVFSAVGRAVSGEESLQKVAGDVYAEWRGRAWKLRSQYPFRTSASKSR